MKQRRIRKTALSFDEEEEEGSVAVPPASVKAAQSQREKGGLGKKRSDSKPLLSFDEDLGAGDGAQPASKEASKKKDIGKPRPSLRAPGTSRAPETKAAVPSTQVSAAGEYTAERIKELQKNALRAPSSSAPSSRPSSSAAAPVAAGGFKLSGSFKPAGAPKDSRFQYDVRAAEVLRPPETEQQAPHAQRGGGGRAAAATGDDEMPLPPPPPRGAVGAGGGVSSAGAAAAGAGEDGQAVAQFSDDEDELDIPDEQTIQWAKAKRERLRSAHLAPDYIPTASIPGLGRLRDKKQQEEKVGAGSGSEDELEEHMRLQFMAAGGAGGKRGSKAAAIAAAQGSSGRHSAGAPEEDEEEDWAREQIRKGMGGLMRAEPAAGAAGPPGMQDGGEAIAATLAGGSWAAAGFGGGTSQAGSINAAAEEVMQALQKGLQRLQASHKQADRNLTRTGDSLQGSLDSISRLEGELAAASDKYVHLQKLRAYVQDLCYMLQDKSPLVEELEEHLMKLYEDRAQASRDRRRLDDEESLQPADAAVTAALGVLSRGGAPASAAASAEVAAQAAERRQLGGDMPVELDEFGRDVNTERRHEAEKRAKQRQAWLEVAEAQLRQQREGQQGGAEPRLGEATSEESEGEVAHFRLRQGEVQEAADAVFKDAADEFGSLSSVKRQLEEWKARYPGAYRDAYMSVSAPALFAPFVRLELLKWRPLEGGATGFDMHQWYEQLFDYGMGPDPAQADPDDPDANLVPQLVQKLVLPLARQLLEWVWDPLSRRQSKAAASMLADLLVYVPPEDEGLQDLVRLVQSKLESAIQSTALPAWPPSALAASPRAEAFLLHRFGRALRLLRGVCNFEGSLPRGVLQTLALEQLVSKQLLPFIRIAAADIPKAADRVARTVAALPAEWFRGGPLRGCEGLLDFCNTLARSLEAQAAAGEQAGRAANAAAAKRLSDAMHKLGGDAARANRLAKVYGVL